MTPRDEGTEMDEGDKAPRAGAPGARQYPHLFGRGRIGPLTLRNRILLAPMGTGYGDLDGRPTDRHLHYYGERAAGGAGMIITELVKVEKEIDPSPAGTALRLDSDHQIGRFNDLVEAIHDHGAAACVQLTPGLGRQAEAATPEDRPVSASEVPAFMNPAVTCRSLTRDEIRALVDRFGQAAVRAARAGFDAIEIHGHTGYLVDQFLAPVWNKRTDQYGGSLANRLRFARELVGAVRQRLGPEFPLSFRFSAQLKIPEERTMEEAVDIARRLVEAGVSVLHVDAGCYQSMPWIFPPMYFGEGCLLSMARAIKNTVSVPVIAVGNILEPAVAEQALASRQCDFVASGRGLLADPHWPRKALEGREEEIRRCIMCNEFCVGKILEGKPISCVLNPRAGKERFYQMGPAAVKRRVAVVGGGPAGMEAACTAAERGHQVTLYEKSDELGGQLLLASAPDFKRSLEYPIDYLTQRLKRSGVKVRLGTEATPERVARDDPDVVILATGARPLVPDLPGINGDNVVTAWDIHRQAREGRATKRRADREAAAAAIGMAGEEETEAKTPDGLGRRVVVAGGGQVGCETALELATDGHQVTVVEMLPEVATDLNLANRFALLPLLAQAKVSIQTGQRITAITGDGVRTVDQKGQEHLVEADTVVLALGSEPVRDLVEDFEARFPRVLLAGDCNRPRKIGEAIHEGFSVALDV